MSAGPRETVSKRSLPLLPSLSLLPPPHLCRLDVNVVSVTATLGPNHKHTVCERAAAAEKQKQHGCLSVCLLVVVVVTCAVFKKIMQENNCNKENYSALQQFAL